MNNSLQKISTIGLCLVLSGCLYDTRPKFTPVAQSIEQGMEQEVIPSPIMASGRKKVRATGSLWQSGSSNFFKDSRARKSGDIVTVIVDETAQAEVEAKTESTRVNESTSGITNILNFQDKFTKRGIVPGVASLLDTDSDRTYTGDASTERDDKLTGRIAAMVTQVLPNGYLAIQGHREVMINYELQEMTLTGIIRPDDISPDNTIPSEKIAQARISYAGRGMIDEAQQPQPAVRFIDKWLPF